MAATATEFSAFAAISFRFVPQGVVAFFLLVIFSDSVTVNAMSSGTRHTHTRTHTAALVDWNVERSGWAGVVGGTGKEVNEGGWEVCARNRRQAGQPIPLDCIFFFSACRGRVTLYVCVCLALLVCVTIHQHCVERRRRRLRRRRR